MAAVRSVLLALIGSLLLIATRPVIAQSLLRPLSPPPTQPTSASTEQAKPAVAPVETRLQRLERILDSQVLSEMLQSLQALQEEVRELRGEIESQTNEIEMVRKRQRDLYTDTDRRLRELEVGGPHSLREGGENLPGGPTGGSDVLNLSSTPSQIMSGEIAPVATAATIRETESGLAGQTQPDAGMEKAEYDAAFEHLTSGNYAEALAAFSRFLEKYPNGRYAANAQYWLGEANYVSSDFESALSEFRKVVESYPASSKAADARLKIGYAHFELGHWQEAQKALRAIVRDYPNTTVARLAEQRLIRMKQYGR